MHLGGEKVDNVSCEMKEHWSLHYPVYIPVIAITIQKNKDSSWEVFLVYYIFFLIRTETRHVFAGKING